MDVVNPFILKNKIGMVKFVDELCNIELVEPALIDNSVDCDTNNNNNSNDSSEPNNSFEQHSDLTHDLATVHEICEKYLADLEQQAEVSQTARKLVTTLKLLSKNKQYLIREIIVRNCGTA